jgi:hypothetical protein
LPAIEEAAITSTGSPNGALTAAAKPTVHHLDAKSGAVGLTR